MVGSRLTDIRIRSWTAFCLGILACLAAHGASAADCPGHPDALGTSRTLVVDPREHPRIGSMQYPETLPLRDHEVVLTFDDGPLPKHSNQILQILADQCIKATFFTIGRQAQANPEGVRKLVAAGHTVGTHSQNHPLTFRKMSYDQAKPEIDQGIASVTAALSDPAQLAPFFRIPGLERAGPVETYAASMGIQVWSADFLADDWRHISSARVYDLAIKRLEARGKGILLLHDIQPRTVAALPRILQEMKARGYRIVHVVPATQQQPPTPSEPEEWLSRPSAAAVAALAWPKVPAFIYAEHASLPAPALADFGSPNGALLLASEPFDRAKQHGAAMPRETTWPHLAALPPTNAAATLPVPAADLFTLAEPIKTPRPLLSGSRRAGQSVPVAQEAARETSPATGTKAGSGSNHAATTDQTSTRKRAEHGAGHGKHVLHRRSVKMASLKKR
jgi:peptidoglycan/xylan/chitin deacetylase (PgdA/CDA1 family)